ncbi:BPSL0761 family protein [Paraburkholderia dipogonis]|uniref:BPSL0761 family protein n=1 Tax=Paraburkholderia dipogonis TaxID=1211383 RepID=UPI0038BCD7EA
MTTPAERTKAVLDTRDFLSLLAASPEVTIHGLVQSVAIGLLRHYPVKVDMDASASALPGVWAHPTIECPKELASANRAVPVFATRADE